MKSIKTAKIAATTGLLATTMMFSSLSSAAISTYSQNLEGMDPNNGAALSDDGWLVGANVFDSTGANYIYGYFAFPAPNIAGGGPAFSGVATGEGGAAQGSNQFNTYSDYNNADHSNASGNRIAAVIFRDIGTIEVGDVGSTWDFDFDVKSGNIGGATTAAAFIKVVQTSNGSFAELANIAIDTTSVGASWTSLTASLFIDAAYAGETLQIGFTNTASNGDSSGVFYDNINVQAVPVPAAAWLMGSALLGLVGVKRSRK